MRHDAVGMFWDDTPPPKVLKEKKKAIPPDRVWESPDYLPGLERALAYPYDYFTDYELMLEQQKRNPLIFDVECYPNYFLVSFMSYVTGKVVCFELDDTLEFSPDMKKLRWVLTSFPLVGFNSRSYDLPVIEAFHNGATCEELHQLTEAIIVRDERGDDILKRSGIKRLRLNHVDLIEVAPLQGSLKIYGGRLHSRRMQDLPFAPGTLLSANQRAIVKMYNVASDLPATAYVLQGLEEQIELRANLSAEYGVDLRSKSDAQIAEAVIIAEVSKLNRERVYRPEITPGRTFRYIPPAYIEFQTPYLNSMFETVCGSEFTIDEGGVVGLPATIKELKLTIGSGLYQMGLGGLHSNEHRTAYFTDARYTLYDRDVKSYYPQLILNSGMYPVNLGLNFLKVYQRIVTRRLEAKAAGQHVIAGSLKITANGTFGKLGSPWSYLYAPHLMIQVTLTGQLSLLMLIERMELAGITVVSANTDGIVMHCKNESHQTYLDIVAQWEKDTHLETEETIYKALYSRDVNNYVAVKKKGGVKGKGIYLDPWAEPELAIFRFHKNPVNLICTEAVQAYVQDGTFPSTTIGRCTDIRRFVTVRKVKGGAVKDGEYLGSSIRWYYATGITGEMVYARSGNKVPRTEGAKAVLDLPDSLPEDVDFQWYIKEACAMIAQLGLEPPE